MVAMLGAEVAFSWSAGGKKADKVRSGKVITFVRPLKLVH